jgi:hypothetical protein
MNCKKCNNLLESQARFCAECGAPVEEETIVSRADQTQPAIPMAFQPIEATTPVPSQQSTPLVVNPQSLSQQQLQMGQAPWSQPNTYSQTGETLPYSQQYASSYPLPNQEMPSVQTAPLLVNKPLHLEADATPRRPRRPHSLGGCFLRLIAVLLVLSATLVGLWFFAIQPYVHAIVKSKLNDTMTQIVDQLPTLSPEARPPFLPPGPITLPPITITENLLQTLLKSNTRPSDPVQNPVVHINQQGVRLEFSVQPPILPFSFPCAVSFRPVLNEQGTLVVRDVNLEGIASLAISSEDLTSLLNQHISDAMKKLNNPISSFDLHQGEMVITLKL